MQFIKRLILIGIWGCFNSLLQAQESLPNFNALFDAPKLESQTRRISTIASNPLIRNNHSPQIEERLGVPTFLFASDQVTQPTLPRSATSRRDQIATTAKAYLQQFSSFYRLNENSLSGAILKSIHDTGRGAVIARFNQQVNGIEVFLSHMNVMMDPQFKLVAISGYLSPHVSALEKGTSEEFRARVAKQLPFQLTPQKAIALAFQDLGGKIKEDTLTLNQTKGIYHYYKTKKFLSDYVMREPARLKKVFFNLQSHMVPGYYIELVAGYFDTNKSDAYSYVISAEDGRLLFRNNLIAHSDFTYKVYADATPPHIPFDSPRGNSGTPYPLSEIPTGDLSELTATDLATFRPDEVPQTEIRLSHGPISTQDPWLPELATTTSGNNVDAYADVSGSDGFDANDFRAEITAPSTFDYPYSLTKSPQEDNNQSRAAVVNLFYVNNFLHDWFYDVGFDEAAGNAQSQNFGRGGVQGDPLLAEAQDFSGTNNANMFTPSDGASPRMQMYIFDDPKLKFVTILSPSDIADELPARHAVFGPQTFELTGSLVRYDDGQTGDEGTINDGCETAINANALKNNIAIIDRGVCTFVVKVKNAQTAGALGVLIANNRDGSALTTMAGEDESITIPAMLISQNGGQTIYSKLANHETVSVRLIRTPTNELAVDGTMANSIVAHEWGHYISNRLIGNGNGLGNNQGGSLGEGWSDFHSLLMTVQAVDKQHPGNDRFQGIYAQSGFTKQSYYFGVRRAPYSTDFQWNALTFKHIADGETLETEHPLSFGQDGQNNSQVHASGEIWANMLWEVYASLLNDSNRVFQEAQDQMKAYLVESYKMIPISPTYTEARDALLSVALANSSLDYQLMAAAFTKRGMGPLAKAPERDSTTHEGVTEDFSGTAQLTFLNAQLDNNWQYCDLDGIWDPGETALLTVTLANSGTVPLTDTTATVTPSNGKVLFSNGGTITFADSTSGQHITGTIEATLDKTATFAHLEPVTLTIAYQDSVLATTPPPESIQAHVNYSLGAPSNRDTVNEYHTDWSIESNSATTWSMRTLSSFEIFLADTSQGAGYYINDPEHITDTHLVSPIMTVATPTELTITFDHIHEFEPDNYDGGVVELKVICCDADQGVWHDINHWGTDIVMAPGYNGIMDNQAPTNPLAGRNSFVELNSSFPSFVTETIDLRSRLNSGDQFQIRFRMGSDRYAGEWGWFIDNIQFNGIANLPFQAIVSETGVCSSQAITTTSLEGAGWHLASPGDFNDLGILFAEQPNLKSIWGWNGEAWEVKFRDSSITHSYLPLSQLQKKRGYWFATKGDISITAEQGEVNHFSDYQLTPGTGWHLLGTPRTIDVINFFEKSLPETSSLWNWSKNQWSVYSKGDTGTTNQFNDTQNTQMNNLRTLGTSAGFWIKL